MPASRALPIDWAPDDVVERVVALKSVAFQAGIIVGPHFWVHICNWAFISIFSSCYFLLRCESAFAISWPIYNSATGNHRW